jgi:hypothetical protein
MSIPPTIHHKHIPSNNASQLTDLTKSWSTIAAQSDANCTIAAMGMDALGLDGEESGEM